MGVEKEVLQAGTGDIPRPGQTVKIEYTGWLRDPSQADNKGKQFDSSDGRGDFETKIGVGVVIKGWDEAVTQMRVGEKARLNISSDYAYGDHGFTGHIPPNSALIFEVYLKGIVN